MMFIENLKLFFTPLHERERERPVAHKGNLSHAASLRDKFLNNRDSARAGKYWSKRACFLLFLLSTYLIINADIDLTLAEQERDPFVSLSEQEKILEESFDISTLPYPVKLNGIIWKKGYSIAIINTEIVQKGDIWKDLTVEDIKKDRVILKYGDFRFEILLEEEKDKKR